MEREVEVKARADLALVRQRLTELGAELVAVEEQLDIYFEHPCRSLLKGDEALRLRIAGERAELTYKGSREGGAAKSREEVSVAVSSAEGMRQILERLGFREEVKVVKRREVYRLERVEVALDEVEGLGSFVELESRGVSEGELLDLLQRLGGGEVVGATYAEMARARLQRAPTPADLNDFG